MRSGAGTTTPDDNEDNWPTFELSPAEYEQAVARIAQSAGHEVADWRVQLLEPVEGIDGSYIVDVTVRFQLAGMDFLVLFECKRHASPVKREHVLVLHAKLQSTGAQKGVLVAASGFQSGALEYARAHGIACVRLVDEAWTYVLRSGLGKHVVPSPTGVFAGFVLTPGQADWLFTVPT